MLPKSQRLNLKKDFKWVASGKKIETKYMKLFLKYGNQQIGPGSRLGIALSSKVFAKAIQRNKAKRLVSAAFEYVIKNLPLGLNIVALPKLSILSVKSQEVTLDLEKVLKGEKIIN